ncbi:LysR family transcriptional regulator [Saccharopolyspora hattusasensis]|uniref:LysR family transcriptional regulator n=1 Tax=Saccharopolyspora hattusasensis TaxID=1128679 RepID=UPI003D997A55
MDAQRLLVFREIVQAGSLGAAARALGWTEPAVSQHLRRLERQAGTALVLRHSRGVALPEAGQVRLPGMPKHRDQAGWVRSAL